MWGILEILTPFRKDSTENFNKWQVEIEKKKKKQNKKKSLKMDTYTKLTFF
jgi:hypothetical protein